VPSEIRAVEPPLPDAGRSSWTHLLGGISPERATPPEEARQGRGPSLAARYRVINEIGHGGMGRVYRALDRSTGRVVTLKRLRIEDGASDGSLGDARLTLAQEFRLLASLRHPNIISVLDYSFARMRARKGFPPPRHPETSTGSGRAVGAGGQVGSPGGASATAGGRFRGPASGRTGVPARGRSGAPSR
jgi:Protein kinase domain